MTDKKLTNNNSISKKSLSDLLVEYGFVLPVTDKGIELSNEKYGTTNIILPKEVDSPDFIFKQTKNVPQKKHKGKVRDIKPKQNDYFKKLVLAAEIVNQLYTEPTFGHKKFVKINFLCEEICNMQLSTNYGQYAAGPLDPKNLHSIDAEFKRRKWFVVQKREGGFGYYYTPDVNVNDYKIYYSHYFKNQMGSINKVINLFKKSSSNFCEIVATLFAVWKKEIVNVGYCTDEILIEKFYSWSEEKLKFKREELINALQWMNDNQIVPVT